MIADTYERCVCGRCCHAISFIVPFKSIGGVISLKGRPWFDASKGVDGWLGLELQIRVGVEGRDKRRDEISARKYTCSLNCGVHTLSVQGGPYLEWKTRP